MAAMGGFRPVHLKSGVLHARVDVPLAGWTVRRRLVTIDQALPRVFPSPALQLCTEPTRSWRPPRWANRD
jgi:hypothetical protein